MSLFDFGWSSDLDGRFSPYLTSGWQPARVVEEHRGGYRVHDGTTERPAVLAGRLRHEALVRSDLPAVGDWIAISLAPDDGPVLIQAVLPRTSAFVRKQAGSAWDEQVVAANVTALFLVSALNRDFNPRRIERYLVLARNADAEPVVILNKADLHPDPQAAVADVRAIAPDVAVLAVSAESGAGLEALAVYLGQGQTVALLGSSGVGKSTLVNRLTGREVNRVQAARDDDDRGRHTTTHRQLVLLPTGGVLVDTPGMRELALWDSQSGFEQTFQDVASLAASCRFHDCRHEGDAGCAVQAAIQADEFDAGRLESYRKLERELRYQERKADPELQRTEREHWKKLSKALKRRYRES